MRIFGVAALACAVATGAWGQIPEQAPEQTPAQAFYRASLRGDCTGYEAIGAKALASRTDTDTEAWVAVAAGACAARAGQLDLAEQLGRRLVSAEPAIGDTTLSILARRYGILVAGAPGGGPVAARVLDRVMAVLPPTASRWTLSSTYALALFAAGRVEEGRAVLGQNKPGVTALSALVQVDRSFEPVWMSPEALTTALRDRPRPPPPAEDDWFARFWAAVSDGRDEEALAIARRQIKLETTDFDEALYRSDGRGWRARQVLVIHLVKLGRVEEALGVFDQGVADGQEARVRDIRRVALQVLGPALLRADRAADARRLLDAELAIGDLGLAQFEDFAELRSCLGDGPLPATFSSWKAALDCGAPEDQIAALLMAALDNPEQRAWALVSASEPSIAPVFGRRDAEYRRTREAVFARAEVNAEIERRGRRLPPQIVRELLR